MTTICPGLLRFGFRVFFCINFMTSGLFLVPCRWLHPLIVIPSRSKNVVFEWFVASSILAWSSARMGYVDLISDGGGYNIEHFQQAHTRTHRHHAYDPRGRGREAPSIVG